MKSVNENQFSKEENLTNNTNITYGGIVMATSKNIYKTIYSRKLAGYLLLKGFELEKFRKSHADEDRTVFLFYSSPELLRAMSDYNRLNNYLEAAVNI